MDRQEPPPSTWLHDDCTTKGESSACPPIPKLNLDFLFQLHTVRVHDASKDPKTAEELLKQMLLAINIIETEWGSTMITCTTDASGESQKAWRLLRQKLPHLVSPDCLTHQVLYPSKLYI